MNNSKIINNEKKIFNEYIEKIIKKINNIDIKNLEKNNSPHCMHIIFNYIFLSLLDYLIENIKEEKSYYIMIKKKMIIKMKKNFKFFSNKWEKSINNKLLLLKIEKTYEIPNFEILNFLNFENNWDKLKLNNKEEIWNKLRQLQMISDIMYIIPEEIFQGFKNIIKNYNSIIGGSEINKLMECILQNDYFLYGIKKITNEMKNKNILPIPPSYLNILKKAENY